MSPFVAQGGAIFLNIKQIRRCLEGPVLGKIPHVLHAVPWNTLGALDIDMLLADVYLHNNVNCHYIL